MVCALLLIARGASSAARWRCHPLFHSVSVCVLVLAFEMGSENHRFDFFLNQIFRYFFNFKSC